MKAPLPINIVDLMWEKFTNMSATKKERVQVGWGAIVAILLVMNLAGTVDIRTIVNSVKAIPEIQKEQAKQAEDIKKQAEDIKRIFDVLGRNKIGMAEPTDTISTASYE